MKTLVVNNQTKYLSKLLDYLPGEKVVIGLEQLVGLNKDFDVLVLTGGSRVPTVMRHPDVYKNEIELIKQIDKPILGICLGSEIITVAFGGTLKELLQDERGECVIAIGEEIFNVQEAHSIGIDKMPDDFEIIGKSKHSPEIIKHKTKPIIGVQFHPEISANKNFDKWLFKELGL